MEARAASDLADWLVHLDLEGKATRTLYEYTRKIAPLLRLVPDKTIEEITHTDVNEALRKLPERSRYISRSIYNSWFSWALFDERIDRNPMLKVARMRQPKRRPKDIFSDGEIALLEGLPTPDGQLFTILFNSGLRRGEARHLRRDHIDLGRQRLIVYHGKGDKDRIVPLRATVLAAIADLDLLEPLDRTDYLWYSKRGRLRYRHTPIGDTTFENWYKRAIALAGVRYLNPHQTRHTYGHLLREQNFDLEERALLMGHESSETTQRYYGTLTIEDVAKKVNAL
jgi:integrase/recombinase XerD